MSEEVQSGPEQTIPAEYLNAWKDLQEEGQRAARRGDTTELANVRKRKAEYARFLSSQFGKRGKHRALLDPYKKPRQTVSAAYKLALEAISHVLPDLANHLKESIRLGTEFCYSPPSDTTWTT